MKKLEEYCKWLVFNKTKPRSIKELLKILMDNLYTCMGNYYYIKDNDYPLGGCRGLCSCVMDLEVLKLITEEEEELLSDWLNENLPERRYGLYCWGERLIEPRVSWLDEQIKKLNKK